MDFYTKSTFYSSKSEIFLFFRRNVSFMLKIKMCVFEYSYVSNGEFHLPSFSTIMIPTVVSFLEINLADMKFRLFICLITS